MDALVLQVITQIRDIEDVLWFLELVVDMRMLNGNREVELPSAIHTHLGNAVAPPPCLQGCHLPMATAPVEDTGASWPHDKPQS
jgi:hypothetical protein